MQLWDLEWDAAMHLLQRGWLQP